MNVTILNIEQIPGSNVMIAVQGALVVKSLL